MNEVHQRERAEKKASQEKNSGFSGLSMRSGPRVEYGGMIVTVTRFIVSAILLMITVLAGPEGAVKQILLAISLLAAGFDVVIGAAISISRLKPLDERVLITITAIALLVLGKLFDAAALMLIYKLGSNIANRMLKNTDKPLERLKKLVPNTVLLCRGEQISAVPLSEVKTGDIVMVRQGERFALDGKIITGTTVVNTSLITGEAPPLNVKPGDTVLAGFLNTSQSVTVEVLGGYEQSAVSVLLELAGKKERKKAGYEAFADLFSGYYTPVLMLVAVVTAVLPPLLLDGDWYKWVERALALIVIAAPSAVAISIPLTYFSGIAGALCNGILYSGSRAMEKLGKAGIIVFDKTATLSTGRFRVVSVEPEGISIDSLLMMAAHAESFSEHPIARAITEAYNGTVDISVVSGHNVYPGLGISMKVRNITICCGNLSFMRTLGVETGDSSGDEGVVYVSANRKYAGRIQLLDTLKEDAPAAVFQLQSMGCEKIVMLSGDKEPEARKMANALGIGEYHAECLEEDKAAYIEKLNENKKKDEVAVFVSSGIDGSQAMSRADIGVYMRLTRPSRAFERSDIVILSGKPTRVADAISISRNTGVIALQNIVLALSSYLVLSVLGVSGLIPLWLIALTEAAVILLTLFNAMRAKLVDIA